MARVGMVCLGLVVDASLELSEKIRWGKPMSMRKSASFLIPASLITLYYLFWIAAMVFLLAKFPSLREYFPIGGVTALADRGRDLAESFEPIYSTVEENLLTTVAPIRLMLARLGAAAMIVPVSWVYFITSPAKEVDQSFAQTIIVMPIVVTGIAMIVVNSVALAFSLAGVVAAVRFRFTLRNPAQAMYIFVAIGIGLGLGIGALGVVSVISIVFVFSTLIIWKLEYGRVLSGPFMAMLTRRNRAEDDY